MSAISFIMTTDGTINAVLSTGKSLPPISSDHPNYKAIRHALGERDEDRLLALCDVAAGVAAQTDGQIVLDKATRRVTYKGQEIHNVVVTAAMQLIDQGLDCGHLLRFLERLFANPSYRARNQLYQFLEKHGLPITEDGHFLAYKRVRPADPQGRYFDHHTGRFEYKIGVEARVDRGEVDDNPANDCSHGLHAGDREYVRTFGHGPVMLSKIDPADVVSVPQYDVRKLRTCALTPLKIDEAEAFGLKTTVYHAEVGRVEPVPSANDDCDDCEAEDAAEETSPPAPFSGPMPPAFLFGLVPGSTPADWRKVGQGWAHRDSDWDDSEPLSPGFVVIADPDESFCDTGDYEDISDELSPLRLVTQEPHDVYLTRQRTIAVGCCVHPLAQWLDPSFSKPLARQHGYSDEEYDRTMRAILAIGLANNLG